MLTIKLNKVDLSISFLIKYVILNARNLILFYIEES